MLALSPDWEQERSLPEGSPSSDVRLQLLDPRQLSSAELQSWEALAAASGSTNPFVQPWLQRLSLAHFDPAGAVRLAVVADSETGWHGAVPLTMERPGRIPAGVWTAFGHANQFTGTPLVRPDRAAAFWQHLLVWLDAAPGGAVALALQNLAMNDPVNQALFDLCKRQGRRLVCDRSWQRAVLGPGQGRGELPGKLRRRIEGLERKREREHGLLSLELTREPGRIAELIEEFVALESSGWKGAAGSALASREATNRFFHEVAQAGAKRFAFEFGVLRSGEQIVAMSSQLIAGATIHGFKAAYDEAFAAHAPGLLLLNRLTRHWQTQGVALVDSCTRPGQEPVSKLWPGRRELSDCRVALGGSGRRAGFAALLTAEAVWHAVKRLGSSGADADKA